MSVASRTYALRWVRITPLTWALLGRRENCSREVVALQLLPLLHAGAAVLTAMQPSVPIVLASSSSAVCYRRSGPSDIAFAPDSEATIATPARYVYGMRIKPYA